MGEDKKTILGAELHTSQVVGFIIVLLIVGGIVGWLYTQWMAMEKDLRLALTMVFFVWILNWARKNLGSPRLAIVYAIVLAYIVFFKHPSVVWWIFGILILVTFGAKFWSKITPSPPEKDQLLDKIKDVKLVVYPSYAPMPMAQYYHPYPYQQGGGEKK